MPREALKGDLQRQVCYIPSLQGNEDEPSLLPNVDVSQCNEHFGNLGQGWNGRRKTLGESWFWRVGCEASIPSLQN